MGGCWCRTGDGTGMGVGTPAPPPLDDVMAGIGPFAVPAALAGQRVVKANDLNPNAYDALKANVALNRVCAARCHLVGLSV